MARRILQCREVWIYAPQVIHSLAFYAEELGLSDYHLAEMTGFDVRTIENWWLGRQMPSIDTLEGVCADMDLRVRLRPATEFYKRRALNREFNLMTS